MDNLPRVTIRQQIRLIYLFIHLFILLLYVLKKK